MLTVVLSCTNTNVCGHHCSCDAINKKRKKKTFCLNDVICRKQDTCLAKLSISSVKFFFNIFLLQINDNVLIYRYIKHNG